MAPIYICFGILATLFLNSDGKSLQWTPNWYIKRHRQRLNAEQDLDWSWQRGERFRLFAWWIFGILFWPVISLIYAVETVIQLAKRCCGRKIKTDKNEPMEMVEETQEQPARSIDETIV